MNTRSAASFPVTEWKWTLRASSVRWKGPSQAQVPPGRPAWTGESPSLLGNMRSVSDSVRMHGIRAENQPDPCIDESGRSLSPAGGKACTD